MGYYPGGYSPSKINIVLGQVSLVLWSIAFLVHLFVLCFNHFKLINSCCLMGVLLVSVVVTILLIISKRISGSFIKSSYFKD